MSFNVNFLGGIPYNPDNLHVPENQEFTEQEKLFDGVAGRLLGYSFNQMMSMYWTVRSFEIKVGVSVVDTIDPLSQFIQGGGTSAGVIGAIGGLASISSRNGGLNEKGYTQIYSKYNKKVRMAREGILKGITQPMFKDLKSESLNVDTEFRDPTDPNKERPYLLESHIYKPNEGTLCSAGPVHIFSRANVIIMLDFSNILYYGLRNTGARLYWPQILIYINVPNAGAEFGNLITGQIYLSDSSGFINNGLSFINLNSVNFSANFGLQRINSRIYNTQIANVNIDIQPGKRCCDRFLWDGKDSLPETDARQEDGDTKTPKPDSDETCKDVCGDADPDPAKKLTGGVYKKISEKRQKL
jgi:hypothetical protein